MEISIDRRAPSAEPGKEIKFAVSVRSIDEYHTHGELTHCDQAEIRRLLALLADEVEAVLQANGEKETHPTPPDADRDPGTRIKEIGW